MLQMDPVRVPEGFVRPLQGRDPVFEPIPRVALCGYAASLTLGFGVRRFRRQHAETSQRGEVPLAGLRRGRASPGTGILVSRWFLIGVVEFELSFGLSLWGGLSPTWSWRSALACFGLFSAVSLFQALSDEARAHR